MMAYRGLGGAVIAGLFAVILLPTSVSAVDYNTIPGGQGTAQTLDTQCYNAYWAARSGSSNLKAVTNGSAYNGMDWISAAGNTGQQEITVAAGSTTPIQLKLNHLDYICYGATNGGTNDLGTVDARMRSGEARDGRDAIPVAWTGYANSPNRTFYGFGLYGLGASSGTIASYNYGGQVIAARNDGTRFWHVTSDFTYNPPAGGFQQSQEVTISATIRGINQYYYRNNPTWGWEISCWSGMKWNDTRGNNPGSHSSLPDRWFTDQCGNQTLELKLKIVVPHNYNLTPQVSNSAGATAVAQGTIVPFTYSVAKTGTDSRSTDYAIRQVVIPAGKNFNQSVGMLDEAYRADGSCDPRYGANFPCTFTALATGTRTFTGSPTTITGAPSLDTSSYPIGTTICRILAVDPPTHEDSPRHRWSAPSCVTVSKKPYIAVINGDVMAGGSFKNSSGVCPLTDTRGAIGTNATFSGEGTYGSYGEYGLTSLRTVTNFGSAGKPLGTKLTFRNTPSAANQLGYFADSRCLTNALEYYDQQAVSNSLDTSATVLNLSNASSGVYKKLEGGLRLTATDPSAMKFGKNKHVVVIADGDITIERNIEFDNISYTIPSELPSLVVISRSGSIKIAENVTRIDGVFQANKNFVTCQGNEWGAVTESQCNKQLTVNGAVTASKLVLRRTYGAAIQGGVNLRNEPAERFVMRPDIFLSLYGQSTASGQIRSVGESELPPRY